MYAGEGRELTKRKAEAEMDKLQALVRRAEEKVQRKKKRRRTG